MKRILKRLGLGLLALLLIGGAAFAAWALIIPDPLPAALEALRSDEVVAVSDAGWLEFAPAGRAPAAGLVFYPGGRVDPRSYAPAARELAAQGYLVAIPAMPLNLAFFDPNRAAGIIAAHPEIEDWAVGGHSLGGAMAAQYAHNNPQLVNGLVLWASYATAGSSLAGQPIAATSIYATADGLLDQATIDRNRANLPPSTSYVAIEGGNHGQFGWYGEQSGDLPASISREEQQRQAVAATLELLGRIGGD
ncbi:MAG TPA: alpha/beta fold hydrolase [Herpetosiphonaceae bacterium]|nr:alpha/beta fold hydrolase [Herpetosiphonaceae bacterium]